jgi:glycosyltransferase involved in cell wall biosynthesis
MSASMPRFALVLWNGDVGGAEVMTAALAERMRRMGAEATLLFVEQPQPLATRLEGSETPFRSLGFERGRAVLRRPRRYASEVARIGPDGALLVECGFMGGALRAGGYRAPIVAVEHGAILEADSYARRRLMPWRFARMSGAWADDVEVAVSDVILERLWAHPHAADLRRIYNGIDPSLYEGTGAALRPAARAHEGDTATAHADGEHETRCVVAFAARLVHGKGHDYLIEALARLGSACALQLRLAGVGPEGERLRSLARSLGVERRVSFLGLVHDMPAFWQDCDVAVVPSAEFVEACPMTPLEAMAAGRPVIATRNGGLPELVLDGETGLLVAPGDVDALADALRAYARSPALRTAHGANGRARVSARFHVDGCARAYLDLFAELAPAVRARA